LKKFDKHLFICENRRPDNHPRGSCGEKGSQEIIEEFKSKLKSHNTNIKIRINRAGCLDACKFGPTVVIYPEQIWYKGVSVDDIDEIIESHLLNNKPVVRIMLNTKV
jgi:(2Fe-2S) ferredoxin